MEPVAEPASCALGNFVLFDFKSEFFQAFVRRGLPPSVWVQAGESKVFEETDGVVIFRHLSLKRGEVEAVFSPTLSSDLSDRVRRLALPQFIRSANRTERCPSDRGKSWVDYHNRLEMMIHWYHNMLVSNDIKTIIFSSTPHEGSTVAMYYLAREMGLEIAVCYQTNFVNRMFIVNDFHDIGYYKSSVSGEVAHDVKVITQPEPPLYMKMSNSIPSIIGQILRYSAKLALNKVTVKFGGKDKTTLCRRKICSFRDHLKMINIQKKLPGKISFKNKFVYFPLHLQPELDADVYGGMYADQILAVEQLRRIVPDDVHIYVKENPKQTTYAREPSFFKRLQAIPETTYISTSIDSYALIRQCLAIATLVGTAGWEALQMGKPVICFGTAWYRCLPGVFNWKDGVIWSDVENFHFDKERLEHEVAQMSRHFSLGVAQTNYYSGLVDNFDSKINSEIVVGNIIKHFVHAQIQ